MGSMIESVDGYISSIFSHRIMISGEFSYVA